MVADLGDEATRQWDNFLPLLQFPYFDHTGSRAEQLSGKMANTLSASNRLFKTYVPVDIATVREVDSSREAARRKERTANKKSKDAGQKSLRKTDPKR